MDGFEKFLHIFIDYTKKELAEKDYGNDPEYKEVFVNQILGLDGPKQMKRKITTSFTFFSKLYIGFKEISDSYYCLIDIETYISRFPYGDTMISKTRHLAYHMENYINEVYILKERLTSYFNIIGRLYRKDKKHPNILKITKSLFSFVNNSLKGIIDTRGSHVYKARFNDEDIDKLSTQELLAVHGGEELQLIGNIFKMDYRAKRKKYKVIIKRNNTSIKQMLDACFEILFEIVMDKNGHLKYPKIEKA